MRTALAFGTALVLLAMGCRGPGVDTLRVMTWNIHHGRGMDKQVDLERIAAVIRSADPDIVALQEVDRGTRRTDRRDLAAELAKLCGMDHVFGKNIDYQGGDYGNALLTRLPVVHAQNHHYRMLREGEQRGLLRVRLRFGKRELRIWNTHIDFRPDDSERLANVAEIGGILARMNATPVLLCGDFNDTPISRTHKALLESFLDAGQGLTYPSNKPRKRIDYVFVRNNSWLQILEAKVLTTQASDHLPVVTELRVR